MNEDAHGRMFVRWTPQSLLPVNFLGTPTLFTKQDKVTTLTFTNIRDNSVSMDKSEKFQST